MATPGRALDRALIPLLALASAWLAAASASAEPGVLLPACRAAQVEGALLVELVAIELGSESSLEITLDTTLCDASTRRLTFVARDRTTGTTARDAVAIAAHGDAASRTRALALVLVERARLALATAARMRAAPSATIAAAATRDPGPRAELGGAIPLRVALPSGTLAIGARLELGALFEHAWIARADLGAAWARGSAPEGEIDAALVSLGLGGGGVVARADALEVALLGRAEIGVVHAVGTRRDGAASRATTAPWLALGVALDASWWLDPSFALSAAASISGILAGLEITESSGVALSLAYALVDIALGLRVAL